MKTQGNGKTLEAMLERQCIQAGELQAVCLHALAGGSRTRANLLLRAAERNDARAVQAASALEMMHAATLLQDDIFDCSAERRGRRAAYLQFGEAQAVLASDWLLLRSLELAAEVHLLFFQQLACAARNMAATVARELQPSAISGCSARAYIQEICQGKTSSLFAVALYGAALLRERSDSARAPEWAAVGNQIGCTYQLLDDCLDVYATAGTVNKSTGVDLKHGRLTLPLLLALESLQSEGRSISITSFREERLTATELAVLERAVHGDCVRARVEEEVRGQIRAVEETSRPTAIPSVAVKAARDDMEAKSALCFERKVRLPASAAVKQRMAASA